MKNKLFEKLNLDFLLKSIHIRIIKPTVLPKSSLHFPTFFSETSGVPEERPRGQNGPKRRLLSQRLQGSVQETHREARTQPPRDRWSEQGDGPQLLDG